MSELEQLERRIKSLSADDLAKFREWFVEFDWAAWDAQIEADAKSGRLDRLISEAAAEVKANKARDL